MAGAGWLPRAGSTTRLVEALVLGLMTSGDDANMVRVEPEQTRAAGRLGRHRVLPALELDESGRADDDREAEGIGVGRYGQGSQAVPLGSEAGESRYIGTPARAILVEVAQPGVELRPNVVAALEASGPEKASPDNLGEPRGTAGIRLAGGPQLRSEPVIHRGPAERLIPANPQALLLERHGARVVEHRYEGNAAERLERGEQAADERFDAVVRHESNIQIAGVTRSEERRVGK